MSERRQPLWTRPWARLWRWTVGAADWLNGSAHARPAEPLSRCAYNQMMAVMVK